MRHATHRRLTMCRPSARRRRNCLAACAGGSPIAYARMRLVQCDVNIRSGEEVCSKGVFNRLLAGLARRAPMRKRIVPAELHRVSMI